MNIRRSTSISCLINQYLNPQTHKKTNTLIRTHTYVRIYM